MKHLNLLLISMILSVASFAQTAIIGPTSTCVGVATPYSDATLGGTWSSSTVVIATIGYSTGILVGVAAGTTIITYTLPSSAYVTLTVTMNPLPCAITGVPLVCAGSTTTLTDCLGSGVWSSSNPAVATISPGAGVLGGVSTGTAMVTYSDVAGCYVSEVVTVSPLPAAFAITGGGAYCAGGAGADVGLAGSSAGVNYQLYCGGVPVGGTVAGTGTTLDFGLQTVAGTYTVVSSNASTGCVHDMTGSVTVTAVSAPAAYTVSGGGSYCGGSSSGSDITLSSSDIGVTYTLDSGGVADMTLTGTGSALDFGYHLAGTYTITATSGGTTCTSSMTSSAVVASGPLPAAHIVTGGGTYCAGGAGVDVGLDGSDAGINYQLYNGSAAVGAPIAGTGSALSFGLQTAAGTYTVVATNATTSCTNDMTGSATVTVSALPTVTATASSVACDGSYTLTAGGATSYTWAPGTGLSCMGCASPSVNPTASATYTVMGTDGSGCTNTASVSVDGNRIVGTITPSVSGTIEVWLIEFNPADSSITALDSMNACTSGGSQYYYFADPASGNYLVKAYLLGGTPGTSGYIPTYGTSSAHWDAATSIAHTSATDNMGISMIYGTVPSGPGFISGYVASGAGRGTSVGVSGMLIYLTDATGTILTSTQTDASGNYTFSSLANGTYIIYPEAYQYATTTSATITLSSSSENAAGIDFKQLTTSMVIVPFDYNTGVIPIAAQQGINVYPNPASGNFNISWDNQATGTANVMITDVTGREVYKSAININAASGTSQIALPDLNNGIYLLTIKNESIHFTSELQIEE